MDSARLGTAQLTGASHDPRACSHGVTRSRLHAVGRPLSPDAQSPGGKKKKNRSGSEKAPLPLPWPRASASTSARAFAASSRPLFAAHSGALPLPLPLRRAAPAMPLAARARRGLSSSPTAAAPPAEDDDFATAADLRFEPPLEVVKYPDPILRTRNKRINTFDANLRALADEMFDVMYKTDGIGLSAPQVGVNVQLMVFNPAGVKGEGEEIVLVNPVVYKSAKRLLVFEEGCLSFPGIYANVVRPESVKIEAQDVTGAKIKVKLSGLPARVFQHEFDHLLGILFFDRMTTDVLETVREELKNLEKKYEERTGLMSPETVENYKGTNDVFSFSR